MGLDQKIMKNRNLMPLIDLAAKITLECMRNFQKYSKRYFVNPYVWISPSEVFFSLKQLALEVL